MDDNKIIEVVKNSKSMMQAARELGIPFTSFRRKAEMLGIYNTNQGGKGTPKSLIPLNDVLIKGSIYKSTALKNRLFEEKLLEEKCCECGIGPVWNDKPLKLHLDHIDGDNNNNELQNLRILCPNCHSQTETYCRKKKK